MSFIEKIKAMFGGKCSCGCSCEQGEEKKDSCCATGENKESCGCGCEAPKEEVKEGEVEKM